MEVTIMSRGLLGFAVDGELKASYVNDGSYPGGVGLAVLRFVRQLVKDKAVDAAAARVRELRLVDQEHPASEKDMQALRKWTDMEVGVTPARGAMPTWYQLLRRTQGDPDAILSAGYLENASDFALDVVWCEWGWVVDFDKQTIEVYRMIDDYGSEAQAGRWQGYEALDLVRTFAFNDLPSDEAFLTHLARYAE
jgi:hypothetical protein